MCYIPKYSLRDKLITKYFGQKKYGNFPKCVIVKLPHQTIEKEGSRIILSFACHWHKCAGFAPFCRQAPISAVKQLINLNFYIADIFLQAIRTAQKTLLLLLQVSLQLLSVLLFLYAYSSLPDIFLRIRICPTAKYKGIFIIQPR